MALAAAVLGVAIAREAWPWISDDAFISLRYSQRLLAGQGLTWNDGEFVEGYSNLSWVLLTSLLGWFGLDLVTAVRVLGITSTLGACAVLAFGLLPSLPLPARLATVLLAAQPTAVLWSIGGLEAPLAMCCIGVGLWGTLRGIAAEQTAAAQQSFRWAGVAFGLLVLTRPDAPLWVGTAVLTVLACRPRTVGHWRQLLPVVLLLALPPLVLFVAQTGFRVAYFGDWVANTTRAKLAPSLRAWETGFDYLHSAAESLRSLWLPALVGLGFALRERSTRPLAVYTLIALPAWCGYIGSLGGDYFPRNRVLVPTLVPLAALAATGIAGVFGGGAVRRVLAWLLAIGCIALARFDGEWLPGQPVPPPRLPRQLLSCWEWRGIDCGRWLADAFGRQRPLLALDQVGAVPYASGLPCIDMLGLCDRTIATTPIEPERYSLTGHARGNGPYVLSRRPDLVMFLPPPHSPTPTYASGTQMEGDQAFLTGYRMVQFDVDRIDRERCELGAADPMIIHSWVRLEGVVGHGGWQGDRLTVPGYLLGSYRQPYAFKLAMAPLMPGHPDYERWAKDVSDGFQFVLQRALLGVLDRTTGRVLGEVRRPGEHVLRELQLPSGRVRLVPPPLPAGVALRLEVGGTALPLADGVYTVPAAPLDRAAVDVVLAVPGDVGLPFRVGELEIERVR